MTDTGALPRELRSLAAELGERYVSGRLTLVAGAGISRTSGLPGWDEIVRRLEVAAAEAPGQDIRSLRAVLGAVHGGDILGRAESLRRLMGQRNFRVALHGALYQEGTPLPSVSHYHLVSMLDRNRMPEVYTSNFDDLLEVANRTVRGGGRIRHFHGKVGTNWTGRAFVDPPVVTTRDYAAAENDARYGPLVRKLADHTVLLVGLSLHDPNLARVIRASSGDCRAIVVATPGSLAAEEQSARLLMLERFWRDQEVSVYAIEAYEHLPSFLMELRRAIVDRVGKSWSLLGERAWTDRIIASPETVSGNQVLQTELTRLVKAARIQVRSLKHDRALAAGLFLIDKSGELVQRARSGWPRPVKWCNRRRRRSSSRRHLISSPSTARAAPPRVAVRR